MKKNMKVSLWLYRYLHLTEDLVFGLFRVGILIFWSLTAAFFALTWLQLGLGEISDGFASS